MKLLFWTTVAMTLAMAGGSRASDPDISVRGCPPGTASRFKLPVDGPYLQLEQITCIPFRYGGGDALLSPDGAVMARWQDGSSNLIEAASLEGESLLSVPNRVTFKRLVGVLSFDAPIALQWANDSGSLLTIRHRAIDPSGWLLAGLEPVRLGLNGSVEALPLAYPAGPLDGLQWIGGDGLALALFGARGDYYRPRHVDKTPTLAIVDAVQGEVRSSFRLSEHPDLAVRLGGSIPLALPTYATATVLPDGRVRAVLQYSRWGKHISPSTTEAVQIDQPAFRLIWTEGAEPVALVGPAGDAPPGPVVITPDGRGLLVINRVQADGVMTSCCRGGGVRPAVPPPTPVTGSIAELIDVETGQVIWRIQATAADFWSQNTAPSLSADGRYALIQMPPQGGRSMIALISMADGIVLQSFSVASVGSFKQSFGFTPDGEGVWVECASQVFHYSLRHPPT